MLDYGTIIKRSVEVVKKNRWLLVYGALIAGGFASGGSAGGGSSSNSKPDMNLEDLPQKTSSVLGESANIFRDWLASVSPLTWALLAGGILLIVIIGIVAALIMKNWAKASLISGAQLALNDQPTDLSNTSPLGKAKTKSLIIFSFISGGITLAVIILLTIIGGLTYVLMKGAPVMTVLWGIFIAFPTVIALFTFFIFLTMISIYADRLIVLKNLTPWNAWKKALSLSKGNFLDTAVMGIINSVTTGIFGCLTTIIVLLILGIPSLIILLPSLINKKSPPPIVWVFLVIFVLLFIVTVTLISAATAVFKFSNWNQVFNEVFSKEGQPNE